MKNNPQIEDGYTRIATGSEKNDVLMALVRAQLTGVEYQIILYVIRKTWGYNKKDESISLTQMAYYAQKSRRAITYSTQSLENRRLLVRKRVSGKMSLYSLNKNFTSWKVTREQECTSAKTRKKLGNRSAPPRYIKDNINIIYIHDIKKTSRNGLVPCTDEELVEIANRVEVSLEDVKYTHQIILNKIKAKEFKNKTVYHTLENWLVMGIQRKSIKKKEKFPIMG